MRDIFLILLLTFVSSTVAKPKENPTELGTVEWLRDYNTAISRSKTSNKPILILFQEVPGCSTCRNYGQNVLSNPLIVEAIEQYFIPLAIYNNKGGEDARILKKYSEPSWNNPVVRIVDHEGKNLTTRLASNYSSIGLYQSMKLVLEQRNISTDLYFDLLGQELQAQKTGSIKETYFKMYCFWSGEGYLGKYDGVISTEPGFMGGHEVVKVRYDATRLSKETLSNYAQQANCLNIDKTEGYRSDKDPQYYLKQSAYKFLPLSPIQRSKINSALASKKDPKQYLSPTQLRWLQQLKNNQAGLKSLYEKPFKEAWEIKNSEGS